MLSKCKSDWDNTSTPKRRRLGVNRSLRSTIQIFSNQNKFCSPIVKQDNSPDLILSDRCLSPQLPCNQEEYLSDSCNKSLSNGHSAPLIDYAALNSTKWESFEVNDEKIDANTNSKILQSKLAKEIEDISDDMFQSKLEVSMKNRCQLTNRNEKNFRRSIETSFEIINESICGLKRNNKPDLFETKDSFLLDIKESAIVEVKDAKGCDINSFYGLPKLTKSLFKSYRNIEKFYDWQEECLSLKTIKEGKNLIYALPTSGGKTLVAEVLIMREVINQKKNVLFILPFVAIVQEKIWALSPFALSLGFLVEEYAAGKGHIPPKKRRSKQSVYIATIEKGLALVRSLIELKRLQELGLIVVDELHLIGEAGRGGTLETLLSTVIFANQGIQIVGMSATIGNLHEIAQFLNAEVYQKDFRPVKLTEYVKLGDNLHKIVCSPDGVEIIPDRQLSYDYSALATNMDPDYLGGLVSEVVPQASCLVFCPTKRNAENVSTLLCKLQRREMTTHRTKERESLQSALRDEGANAELVRNVRYGVAYHHAGLASDERNLLEQAFRSGVISVLCCTSTLAAGVNLPAARVIVRAPYVGREPVTLGVYRQMAGRAGRAGVCDNGDSIIICSSREWPQLRAVLSGGLVPARSVLHDNVSGLILSAVALDLATTRLELRRLLGCTLMSITSSDSSKSIKELCDDSIRSLIESEALKVDINKDAGVDQSHAIVGTNCVVFNDSVLSVSTLGRAAIKGCMDLTTAKQLLADLKTASRSLVLMGSVHLLYLVTPHDAAAIRPDYRQYYSLYCDLDEECMQTAKVIGITENNAIRMMTGKPITNVPERVLCRFYLALMLHDLWKQMPFAAVADKYSVPRGTVQSVMTSSASFAACAHRFCEELPELWGFRALFAELAVRLQHCAAPELQQLMELPSVKKARALQLMRAGYKKIEDLAKASAEHLVSSVDHLSRTAANHLIGAARMMLIEKVENLRAEAEEVMDELKVPISLQ